MPLKSNDQQTMNPLQIIERGWWALLIRVQALAFPAVVAFFVWEVKTLTRHETEIQKLEQWKSDIVNVQITKTDVQFSTISASIGSLRDTLTRIETEQKVREQLRLSHP